MSVYIEHPDGRLELCSPDYSEGELEELREQLDFDEDAIPPVEYVAPCPAPTPEVI